MQSKEIMSESPSMGRSELNDEVFFGSPVPWLLKWIFISCAALILITTACIWLKDFRTSSSFSTMTGRMESTDTSSK
ncbi:hypothetical protein HOF92_04040 [bacterium]|nr:hypothetical protein [bacterium]